MGDGHHLHQDAGRLLLSGRRDRSLLPSRRRLIDAEPPDDGLGPAGIVDGGVAQEAGEQGSHPLGPGFPVHQQGLGFIPEASQSGTLDEPTRELS